MNAESPFFLSISMTFLPDNRMLLLSKDGEILIVDPETGNSETYMQLQNIDTGRERGLLDITLDPDFEDNGYFYLYYTPASPKKATIARFQHQENSGGLTSSGDLQSETTLWQDTDGYLSCCHYGGGLDFGPDGKIWLTTADKFQSTTPGERPDTDDLSLDLESSSGKIIRINKDGSIPDGTDGWAANPFIDGVGGNDDSIWAYGLRNPFRARWDDEYGFMYIGEVGGNQQDLAHDDIHVASLDQGGAFYGWPFYEGTPNTYVNDGNSPYDPNDFPSPDNDIADPANGDYYSAPIFSIDHQGNSTSITGGMVYRGDMFPGEWDGVYFYGDYTNDFISYLQLDATGTQVIGEGQLLPSSIGGTTNEVVAIEVGADGALYYAMINSGEVRRVTYGDNHAPVYTNVTMTPQQGDLPLSVTIDASVTDADGDALTYMINFGDGTVITGSVVGGTISVEHTYTNNGLYDVQLSVSDGTVTAYAQAFEAEAGGVNDAPEIEDAQADISLVDTGSTVTFTANATDPENDAMTYIWHFGDGETATGTVGPDGVVTASHVYDTEDTYQAYLEVTDGNGITFSQNIPIVVGEASEVPVTNGLSLLLESDIKIGLLAPGDNTVTAWLDGSGNGNNLFGEGDPQLVANATPTGRPAIHFDGVDDLLQRVNATDTLFNLPDGNEDRTIFFVVDYLDPEGVSSGVAYGAKGSNKTFGLVSEYDDGNLGVQGYGGANDKDSGVDGVAGGFMVQSVVLSNGTYTHYKDGVVIDSGNHGFNTDVQKLILGAEIGGKGESELQISSVLIYNRAVNETERAQIEDYLQNKYITGAVSNNNPPEANADSYETDEGAALVVNASNGVLDNDFDSDYDSLSASVVTGPSNGTLTLNADGSFTYTPNTGFSGSDSFTYAASDGNGGTDQATVSITVNGDTPPPTGDIPVLSGLVAAYASDENVSTGAGGGVTGWLDGSGVGNDLLALGDPQIEQNATPTGKPAIVFDGDGDLLQRINATDGLTGFASGNQDRTIFFVVDYINNNGVSSGVAYGDSASNQAFGLVTEWDDGNLGVQGYGGANDQDSGVDGIAGGFLVQSVVLSNDQYTQYLNGQVIDSGSHVFNTDLQKLVLGAELKGKGEGEMKIASALIYNRALTEQERADVEAYLQEKYITGATGPANEAPNAVADSYTTSEDDALVVNAANGVLDNDSDPDSDPLTASEVTGPANGSLTLNADGSFTYTPNAGFFGQDSFTYEASDGQGGTDTATVTITVTEDTPPPTGDGVPVTAGLVASFASDTAVSATGSTVTGWGDTSGQGNDLVGAGDPQLEANSTPTGEAGIVFDGVGDFLQRVSSSAPLNGLPGGNGDRTLFFVVDYIDNNGVSSGLAYGDRTSNEAFGLVSEWDDGNLGVQGYGGGNDFDSGVDGISGGYIVQSVVLSADQYTQYLNGQVIDSGSHVFNTDVKRLFIGAELKNKGEGEMKVASALIYDRALTEQERADVEAYLQEKYITGATGPANGAPNAVADGYTTSEDDALVINAAAGVLNNDSDPDSDPLTASVVTGPANGNLTLNADGSFTYTPDAGFFGQDSFVYAASDGNGGSDNATVTLTVTEDTPTNGAPDAVADGYTTSEDDALVVNAANGVLGNDSDPDSDPLTASVVTGPANGNLTLNADGSFTYTPNAGFFGQDSFVYAASDGNGGSDNATVTLTVTEDIPAPTGGVPVLSGLVADFRTVQGVETNGATVTGWQDGSGMGNTLMALGDPQLVQGATPTGQAAIVFDGTDDLLQRTDTLSGLVGGSGDRTMFFVVDYIDPERISSGVSYGDAEFNQAFGLVADRSGDLEVQGYGSGVDLDSNVNGVNGGFMVQSVVVDDDYVSHYLNGAFIDGESHVYDTDLQKLVIGAEIGGAGEAQMQVASVLIYDRALTELERADVEGYLQELYIDDQFVF